MSETPGQPVLSGRERLLGPLPVTVAADKADALGAALGSRRAGWVPAIFPISWMTLPEISAAIMALADCEGGVLLHETQSFECVTPLRTGRTYLLMVTIRIQDQDPPRVSLQGVVSDPDDNADPDGNVCARFQAGLRIMVPRNGAGCADA